MTLTDRRIRPLVLILALALGAGTAACGDSDEAATEDTTSTTAAAPTDGGDSHESPDGGCPIDAVELSAAVGVEMAALEGEACGFEATSLEVGHLVEVYYSGLDAMVYEGSEGEAVAGVGDGARWDEDMSDSLLVKRGNRYFSVQVLAMGTQLPDGLESKALAVAVAQLVLSA